MVEDIRRMAEDGLPIPPALVLALVERVEALERLRSTVIAWDNAIERCAAKEQALREELRGLEP